MVLTFTFHETRLVHLVQVRDSGPLWPSYLAFPRAGMGEIHEILIWCVRKISDPSVVKLAWGIIGPVILSTPTYVLVEIRKKILSTHSYLGVHICSKVTCVNPLKTRNPINMCFGKQ